MIHWVFNALLEQISTQTFRVFFKHYILLRENRPGNQSISPLMTNAIVNHTPVTH